MTVPISVVIPAYNAAAYIADTIESIRSQTMQAAEIIVINDGSTDETSAIARAAGITVLDQHNVGSAGSRNRGISAATQPWIAFADADDPWARDKIKLQWLSLERAPNATFSFSDCSQFNDGGVINASVMHEVHHHFESVLRAPLGDYASLCDQVTLDAALLVENVFCHSSLVLRTDRARALGGYDPALRGAEDYDFVLRLTRAHAGTYVDLPLVSYRRHPAAVTSSIPDVREGIAQVALRVLSRPWEYSPRAHEHFRRELPYYLLRCGFAHIRYGDQARAREWLRRSLQERWTIFAMLLYPLTFAVENAAGRRLRDEIVANTCREAFRASTYLKSSAATASAASARR